MGRVSTSAPASIVHVKLGAEPIGRPPDRGSRRRRWSCRATAIAIALARVELFRRRLSQRR